MEINKLNKECKVDFRFELRNQMTMEWVRVLPISGEAIKCTRKRSGTTSGSGGNEMNYSTSRTERANWAKRSRKSDLSDRQPLSKRPSNWNRKSSDAICETRREKDRRWAAHSSSRPIDPEWTIWRCRSCTNLQRERVRRKNDCSGTRCSHIHDKRRHRRWRLDPKSIRLIRRWKPFASTPIDASSRKPSSTEAALEEPKTARRARQVRPRLGNY